MNTASTRYWIILLALTSLSFGMTETSWSGSAILVPVLLATLVKGKVVIDRFMALRHAGALWRGLVLGWLIVVLGLIAYAFHISTH